tara:strand:- start:6304 stop:7293 length:990 start_codon:yes stop_codon:yes gene_type:complete
LNDINLIGVYSPDSSQLELVTGLIEDDIGIIWIDTNASLEVQIDLMSDVVAVIVIPSVFPVELARQCKNLKLVQTISAGTDWIDKGALQDLGIVVSNNGGGNAVAVAEHAISLMVSVYRKLDIQFDSVKKLLWQKNIRKSISPNFNNDVKTLELAGKTVGIIGLGRIGRNVAKRLSGWDCDIIYHDINKVQDVGLNITKCSKVELLEHADIVTLHVPLDNTSKNLINYEELLKMKQNSILINTSRGEVVNQLDLIRALNEGRIFGAGLDVLEDEPILENNSLLSMDNVVITPHLAGFSEEALLKSRMFALSNARLILDGLEPESIVLPT